MITTKSILKSSNRNQQEEKQLGSSLKKSTILYLLLITVVSVSVLFLNMFTVSAATNYEGVALKNTTNVYSNTTRNSSALKDYPKGSILVYQSHNDNWYQATVYVDGQPKTGYINKDDVENATNSPKDLKGVALKNNTSVHSEASTKSGVLKSYDQGSILYYQTFSSDWYQAKVYVDGQPKTGYINKDDVENATNSPKDLKGVALKNRTSVYSEASTKSGALKSYNQGSILYYRTFSSDWYQATVYVNGQPKTGYIKKSHVDNVVKDQKNLKGLALKDRTAVYSEASTNASKLKSYSIGSLLYYQTFSSNWYEATVYVKGQPKTGYIHKSHVEPKAQNQKSFKGIGLNNPTSVYSEADTNSKALKSYDKGSVLIYQNFSENWYKATVYIDGNAQTGYIHKNHVENAVKDQKSLRGIGIKDNTVVHANASTNSKALKSYDAGSLLYYETFTSGWYEATVYVNGKRQTGYIHTNHVERVFDKQESLKGVAESKPTVVYSLAAKSSPKLKSYGEGSILYFKSFSDHWYEATVYVEGNRRTGYIPVESVNTDKLITETKNYNYSFERMVDIQMNSSPKADGAGQINASRDLVEYYANPSNFPLNSDGKYQYLVLSQPAGLNATETNNKILNNAGILAGEAQSFIDAARKYDVNEIYLISHALHETGNGTSTLATGVYVDNNGNVVDTKSKAAHTVYNVFGIGAYDDTPLKSGAKTAFENEWFSPRAAIIGGAKFVAEGYINEGQDTLYKMRWNPDNPGTHQYATHVAWASSQADRIGDIYKTINDYILVFEIPEYDDQPESTDKPATNFIKYPNNVKGEVTGDNLRFREGPSTNHDIIKELPAGKVVQILGTNGVWYKANVDGKTGWLHGNYINLLNLLDITATYLNVRSEPNTNNEPLGQISTTSVAGVLNSKDNLVKQNDWYQIHYNGKKAWISSNNNKWVKER